MAIQIHFEHSGMDELLRTMQNISEENAHKAAGRAAKRAAIAARVAATKRIRAIYTIKARDLKSHAQILLKRDGAILHIKGPMESVTKYKAKKTRKGISVAIKKGNSKLVPRSFEYGRKFMQREGASRLPIRGLYGPSVPQLFGNPEVISAMEERGLAVFEERLRHEFGRLMGGAT
ncbi:MAG: hypothetical protein IJT01_11970 [Selenomonadaceae bacterium]|nr:hypothetical protein [Selenomonadaceae bacterium]